MSRKKKISIILVISILVSMMTAYIINAVNTYTDNTIVANGYGTSNGTIAEYDLSQKSEVTLYAGVVNQRNVFCVEHGEYVDNDVRYSVSSEQTVTDPILSYIIANGSTTSVNPDNSNYYINPAQVALWKYLSDSNIKSDDKNKILNGITSNTPTNDSKTYTTDYNNGISLYKNALKNATNTSNISIQMTQPVTNGNTVTFKVSGNYDGFEVYLNNNAEPSYTYNGSSDKEVSIDISKNTTNNLQIQVKAKVKLYEVKYRILKRSDSQRLIAITKVGNQKYATTNKVASKTLTINTNVSLQKYITKVESATGVVKYDSSTDRKNKYAKTSMDSNFNHSGYEISNINGEKLNNNDDDYKYTNPVKIDLGDKVTYTIRVYNNSSFTSKVTVRDNIGINAKMISTDYKNYNPAYPTYYLICENEEIEAGNFKEYKVEVKYETFVERVLQNTAWIYSTNTTNKQSYRTADADFVKLRGYSVSLNKFISAVNGDYHPWDFDEDGSVNSDDARYIQNYNLGKMDDFKNSPYNYSTEKIEKIIKNIQLNGDVNGDDKLTNGIEEIPGKIEGEPGDALEIVKDAVGKREISRYNPNLRDGDPNKDPYKFNTPVRVHPGDTVTYTIRLQNTGKTPVKITQIYDTFTSKAGVKLIWDKSYGIKGNGDSVDVTENYKGPDGKWDLTDSNRLLITFKNPKTLAAGATEDVTIRFKVQIDENKTNAEQSLLNIAGIIEIKNESNNVVSDSDGQDNNRDSDYIKTRKYSVALEKFVSKVTYGVTKQERINNAEEVKDRDNHPIYEKNGFDKETNEVGLEIGDLVTYTIRLKNTHTFTAVKINQIKDKAEYEASFKLDYYFGENNENATITGSKGSVYKVSGPDASNNYVIESDDPVLLGAGEYEDIQLTFVVDVLSTESHKERVLENTATIMKIANGNYKDDGTLYTVKDSDGDTNNTDKDWVKTKIYKVSLEKYITKVTDANGGNAENISGRDGHPIYDDQNYKQPEKTPGPEEVEVGDIVTYTIKLKNTNTDPATGTKVKIKQIEDISDQTENGLGLTYVGRKTVTGSLGSIYEVGSDPENNNKYKLTATNTATNPELLEPGKVETLTLTFKVDVDEALTVNSQDLKNVAKIIDTSLSNRNNIVVKDTTSRDNSDADWVQTKIYSVSLEKYITKVTDAKGGNSENITGRDGHPIYDDANYKQPDKTPGPVEVEPGDLVTYTIKLKNTNTDPATGTKVKIKQIEDISDQTENGLGLTYVGPGEGSIRFNKQGNIITLTNPPLLNPGQSIYLSLVFEVKVPTKLTGTSQTLVNTAEIVNDSLVNRNDCGVNDSEKADGRGIANNSDSDWVKTKTYAVSLEKYVSKVNGIDVTNINGVNRTGKQQYNNSNTEAYKYNNPVTVSKGNEVTYTITVTNNGDTATKITNLVDYLPDGVKHGEISYADNEYCTEFAHTPSPYDAEGKLDTEQSGKDNGQTQHIISCDSDLEIAPNESKTWDITVTVIEPNISLNILKNVAEIIAMNNRNNVEVMDTTPGNNKDADYIQLDYNSVVDDDPSDDAIIAGTVWNDNLIGKQQNIYDALMKDDDNVYDEDGKIIKKAQLEDIEVYLYRKGVNDAISKVTTDANGYYSFGNKDINNYKTVIDKAEELYIKGPKESDSNRWKGEFYSYYVVFEYDGVKYTSTPDGQTLEDIINSTKDYKIDSNASEGNPEGKTGLTDRTTFNKKFNPMNNEKGINYTTTNEAGYIPQSIYQYNADMMNMKSSTKLIDFGVLFKTLLEKPIENKDSIESIEGKLQYVGLGLRGRDIFDLELTSDVDNIKVTVNEVQGVYKYANKLTLRKSDIVPYEDMANIEKEKSHTYVDSHDQNIRGEDIDESRANTIKEYEDQDITNIKVTYKITVHNASRTAGTATKITNYFDSKYKFEGAYPTLEDADKKENKLEIVEAESKDPSDIDKYGYKTIKTKWGNITQNNSKEIYVVYSYDMEHYKGALVDLNNKERLATYNMSEITEYTTDCGEGQTEYTRGLLDKDSVPGSVRTEKVRLEPDKTGTTSTVDYYFTGAKDIKYEDDTYATPTLYFVRIDSPRVLEGYVFEDLTKIDSTTRIKTGNGKLDNDEKGVYGATVELIEQVDGGKVRYRTTTDKDGKFTFEGYLPGKYIIRYHYGDTPQTTLLHQATDKDNTNAKSYNGEDFQATNNGSNNGGAGVMTISPDESAPFETSVLSTETDFWYSINENEGISTAIDNIKRRKEVSEAVVDPNIFSVDKLKVLNYMRDLVGEYSTDNNGTLTASHIYNIDRDKIYEIAKIASGEVFLAGTGIAIDVNDIVLSEVKVEGIDEVIEKTKMFADTPEMKLTIEETEDLNNIKLPDDMNVQDLIDNNLMTITKQEGNVFLGEWAIFPSESDGRYTGYLVENMNFGISEVPVTTLDLEKRISAFSIKDSTGEATIAEAGIDESGVWKVKVGIVDPSIFGYGVQVEDDRLQGAKLEVTFDITGTIITEINFDNKEVGFPSIKSLADFVSNNLSYNPNLQFMDQDGISQENDDYWEIAKYVEGTPVDGTNEINKTWLDSEGKEYTTVLKAKDDNPLLRLGEKNDETGEYYTNETAKIVLEKVLSSTNSTIEEIVTSTVDSFEYSNTVEILGLDYSMVDTDDTPGPDFAFKDRIRTSERYIIIPGTHYDHAESDILSIFPPTGDTSIHITYYIIAAISLAVLAIGAFGIKKFVVKKQ